MVVSVWQQTGLHSANCAEGLRFHSAVLPCCLRQVRKVQTGDFRRSSSRAVVDVAVSCSDKFRAVPGGASDLFIGKMLKV